MTHNTNEMSEQQTRIELAALYRLLAHFKMTDLIDTHISARVPGTADQFLINRYGVLFHEVQPEDLVKIDPSGQQIASVRAEGAVNVAGFTIHSAIHRAFAPGRQPWEHGSAPSLCYNVTYQMLGIDGGRTHGHELQQAPRPAGMAGRGGSHCFGQSRGR